MARYKAKWVYGPHTLRRGQIKAECEADSLHDFAKALCNNYAYNLGDGFWFAIYDSAEEIESICIEEATDKPAWAKQITDYPVYYFGSGYGEEILCNPSAAQIINQIIGESYGDYDLKITGI
ncbi:MAG: hypothetical protein JXA96_17275 [Sedimentisphaerales bacterium]|nr:hypothetical protein [Sedimentisphaerales bacterium]